MTIMDACQESGAGPFAAGAGATAIASAVRAPSISPSFARTSAICAASFMANTTTGFVCATSAAPPPSRASRGALQMGI